MMIGKQTQAASKRTSGRRATRGSAGFSVSEVVMSICMIFAGALAMDGMTGTAEGFSAHQHQRSQAIAIAQGQLQIIRNLPFEDVAPTAGFVSPNWIAQPGSAPGEITIEIRDQRDGKVKIADVYTVAWNVTPRVGANDITDVALRVSWEGLDGSSREVELEAWRVR